jgi:hypothetical protein
LSGTTGIFDVFWPLFFRSKRNVAKLFTTSLILWILVMMSAEWMKRFAVFGRRKLQSKRLTPSTGSGDQPFYFVDAALEQD